MRAAHPDYYKQPAVQEAFRQGALNVTFPSSPDSSPRRHKLVPQEPSPPSSPSPSFDSTRSLLEQTERPLAGGNSAREERASFGRRAWIKADSSPSSHLAAFAPNIFDSSPPPSRPASPSPGAFRKAEPEPMDECMEPESPTPGAFRRAELVSMDESEEPEGKLEFLSDHALHGRCFRMMSSSPDLCTTEELFSDPLRPDAVAGIAARSSFVHSFTKVDTVVFMDPVVERIEVEAVADSFSLERDWAALLEEIRNSELVETNGLAIDDEGRKTHPKYVSSWNFARSIDGDLLVNTPKMAASLDFLDPNIPPRDRLNHIYFDSIPRVAALILLGPLAPAADSPLLPPKILQAVLNLKSKSVIEETLKSNAGVVGFWLKFCDENQIPVEQRFPANPRVLLGYLATRVNQRNGEPVRSATISKDLGAIKFWHNLHGAKLEMNQAEWTMLFKGLKTVEADPLPKRRHLLVEDLHAVHDRLNFDNAFDVAFWAATLAGFFGMMRSGEFTTPNATHFNPKVHVSSENITYAEKFGDENPENFRIHLPWDKTNKALGRDVGIIASSPDETVDPILALKLHLACNAPPPNMGLFSYRLRDKSGHRQLTKSAWKNRMNVCLLAAGREPISGHEVRIGGCNYYVQLKMKHSTIQKLGGWKSPVWLHYWRDTIGHAAREIKSIRDRREKKIAEKKAIEESEDEEGADEE